jgi:archaellum component FlaF (FlaF/FlaG flagellin family)
VKFLKLKIGPYLLLLLSLGILAFSLINRFKDLIPSNENDNNSLTSIIVKNKSIDLGKINILKPAKAEFTLYNTGNEKLHIDKIETSCHCTYGEIPDQVIFPGDSVSIVVQYNKIKSGYFFQDVLIYGNFWTSPEILSFEGYLIEE